METKGTMLILKGIKGLLHTDPAMAYAQREGYVGEVLDASGETGTHSIQVEAALERINNGHDITALYGFSGGGYNARHIFDRLPPLRRAEIVCVVVLGAPGVVSENFPGVPSIIIHNFSGVAHMNQPDALLSSVA